MDIVNNISHLMNTYNLNNLSKLINLIKEPKKFGNYIIYNSGGNVVELCSSYNSIHKFTVNIIHYANNQFFSIEIDNVCASIKIRKNGDGTNKIIILKITSIVFPEESYILNDLEKVLESEHIIEELILTHI